MSQKFTKTTDRINSVESSVNGVYTMFDSQADWVEENEDEELLSISRILKDTFGESFEKASIHQKLRFLAACCDSMRLDTTWQDAVATASDSDIATLDFPEFFEDTQEAMKLIKDLTEAISRDLTFHNLPIGGFC